MGYAVVLRYVHKLPGIGLYFQYLRGSQLGVAIFFTSRLPPLIHHILNVFLTGASRKMIRVDAYPVVAAMLYVLPFFYSAFVELVTGPVSAHIHAVHSCVAVTAF